MVQRELETSGSGSLSVTPFSVPGPALLTAIEKLIGLPGVVDAAVLAPASWPAPVLVGGNATTTSLSCLVVPPMPASTGAVGLKKVVMSNSNWQEYDCATPLIVIGWVQTLPTADVGVAA